MTEAVSREQLATILIVEDEPRVARLVETILRSANYRAIHAPDARRALEMVAIENPDLVLLDVLLGDDVDGFSVCRDIREFSLVPIIMVTARARQEDKLRGFELGIDDYITKPFSAKELLARVRAVLKRTRQSEPSSSRIEVGDLTIDLAAQRVIRAGQEIILTPTEYRLLVALARQLDLIVPHHTLLSEVWGPEFSDEVDYLRTYVRYLRQKLEDDPAHPRLLLTRPGIGYLLSSASSEAS